MIARKLSVGALCGVVVLATMASNPTEAEADPPKVAPSAPAAFKRSAFRSAAKPALTLSAADTPRIRAALASAFAQFGRDKNATRLMNGGASLGVEADAIYRSAVADFLTRRVERASSPAAGPLAPARLAVTATESYSIESGEVVSATSSSPCAGDMQLAFTIKNRGVQLASGKTARLFANVVRTGAPSVVVSSAWLNLPTIANGATATVQFPPLRHRTPGSGGSCPGGDVIVSLGFVEVKALVDYRLKIQLTDTGADATLLSGPFVPLDFGSSSGSSSGGTDGGCSLKQRCPSGACSWLCPPCPGGLVEVDGGCRVPEGGVTF